MALRNCHPLPTTRFTGRQPSHIHDAHRKPAQATGTKAVPEPTPSALPSLFIFHSLFAHAYKHAAPPFFTSSAPGNIASHDYFPRPPYDRTLRCRCFARSLCVTPLRRHHPTPRVASLLKPRLPEKSTSYPLTTPPPPARLSLQASRRLNGPVSFAFCSLSFDFTFLLRLLYLYISVLLPCLHAPLADLLGRTPVSLLFACPATETGCGLTP